jgi:hypothetical protein
MTWPEVADTALKIGIPGTLTAITALLIARFSHSRDLDKERRRRQQDFLENLGNNFDAFAVSIDAVHVATAVYRQTKPDSPLFSKVMESVDACLDTLEKAELSLGHLQTRLRMSQFDECWKRFQQYDMAAQRFKSLALQDDPVPDEQDLDDAWAETVKTANAFRDAITAAYRTL